MQVITGRTRRRWRPAAPGGRIRWRLSWVGLVRLAVIAIILTNLYVLADGLVRLVMKNRAAEALSQRIAEENGRLQERKKERDYMMSPEYVRDAARSLGYVVRDDRAEAVAEPEDPGAESAAPRDRDTPDPAF